MNFKSRILKLSIILMLVLVLIPVASAMDSEDAFYQEYDCGDEEVVVEEYSGWEVQYAQNEVSSEVEIDSYEEPDNEDYYNGYDQDQVEEDANEIPEFNMDSVDVTPYIDNQYVNDENEEISSEIYDNIVGDFEETSDDELTFNEKISVSQGSIFISKYDATINVEIIGQIINTGFDEGKESKLNNDLAELKNNLLIKQDLKTIHSNDTIVDDLYNIAIGVDYTSNDFAYSIDNSIVGDENVMYSAGTLSCFLNFYPCFDATFSCDFLLDEYNFCGNFLICEHDISCGDFDMIAADFFGDFVVDYILSIQRSICK